MAANNQSKIKTKICYFLPEYSIDTGTHYYHNYELLQALADKFNIFLVVGKAKQPPRIDGINKVYVINKASFMKYISAAFIFLKCRFLGCRKFYFHYGNTYALLCSFLTKITGTKIYVWHCYGVGSRDELPSKLKIPDLLFWLVLKIIDYLVTGTPSIANFYSHKFGIKHQKIIVFSNWINLKRWYRSGEKLQLEGMQNKQIVLYVHTLSWVRGAQYIVDIAKQVLERLPDTLFLVIGDGTLTSEVRNEIDQNNLQGQIIMLGKIPNTQIKVYYENADVFIMPCEAEGFPRVLLECMAMGTPFVATDVGGIRDITTAEQQQYIVPKGDIEAFSQKVIELLENPSRRLELAGIGYTRVKNYSIEKAIDNFLSIISTV